MSKDGKEKQLDSVLISFKDIVRQSYNVKRVDIMATWFADWTKYIEYEKDFDSRQMRSYKPGDIITVSLGFNVGSEQGGNRPAVVIGGNSRADKNIMIVPLGTAKETQKSYEFYLGELTDFNELVGKEKGKKSVAIMNQIRNISKMRIISPKKHQDTCIKLPDDIYANLIEKMQEYIFRKK